MHTPKMFSLVHKMRCSGSHHAGDHLARGLGMDSAEWGVLGHEVPALALETIPGDGVIFNHLIKHASFGGSERRRMFVINCCERVPADVEAQYGIIATLVRAHCAYGLKSMCVRSLARAMLHRTAAQCSSLIVGTTEKCCAAAVKGPHGAFTWNKS